MKAIAAQRKEKKNCNSYNNGAEAVCASKGDESTLNGCFFLSPVRVDGGAGEMKRTHCNKTSPSSKLISFLPTVCTPVHSFRRVCALVCVRALISRLSLCARLPQKKNTAYDSCLWCWVIKSDGCFVYCHWQHYTFSNGIQNVFHSTHTEKRVYFNSFYYWF